MSTNSISQCKGKGSIGHNNREFFSANIDKSRTQNNIVFVNQPIGEAYKELFDGAVQRYNAKQKRNDRKVGDYYESLFNRPPSNSILESADKRKSFYEDLVQVGDKDTCGCGTENGKIAVDCLTEYMNKFHTRNPNFHVFNAVIHVDEATPHLHINYIPVGHYKRGLDTQNGYNQALKEMGFTGADCFRNWREREREVLRNICKAHGLEIKPKEEEKGRGHSFTVSEYKEKKDKITAEAEKRIEELEQRESELVSVTQELETDYKDLRSRIKSLEAHREDITAKCAYEADTCAQIENRSSALAAQESELNEKIQALQDEYRHYHQLQISVDEIADIGEKSKFSSNIVN
jgi:chaperonin cofactor prefoldin